MYTCTHILCIYIFSNNFIITHDGDWSLAGPTGGIGVSTTEALMSAGVHVILAVRDVPKGEA